MHLPVFIVNSAAYGWQTGKLSRKLFANGDDVACIFCLLQMRSQLPIDRFDNDVGEYFEEKNYVGGIIVN